MTRNQCCQWLEIDGEFAIEGVGDLDHGIESEVGFAFKDLGDVGGRRADFVSEGGAGEAGGFHGRNKVFGEADGGAFGAVGVGLPGLFGFGFEGGEAGFHGGGLASCERSGNQTG